MNFNASSNDKPVFPVNESVRFKGAAATVLPPPQMFGLGSNMGMGQLPAPMGLSFNGSKQSGFSASPFDNLSEQNFRKEIAPIHPFVQANEPRFPVFDGEPKRAFGLMSEHEPFMLVNKLERVLEFENGVDYQRVDGQQNVIRGRFFGDLNNAEFEIRVFSWHGSEGKSYAEFNRFCGDGWVYTRFVEQVLRKFGGHAPVQMPDLPVISQEYAESDLEAMLSDVEESYQEIAENSAAELAIQTRKEVGRVMCDKIEEFAARMLNILENSSNCAIVRSLLICLSNMAQSEGLTKRILGQNVHVVQNVGQKWASTQSMFNGLVRIAPSREVQQLADRLLMAL